MRNRAKIIVSEEQLRRLLNVPADVEIRSVEVQQDPLRLSVMVESPRFDPIPPDTEAPILYGGFA